MSRFIFDQKLYIPVVIVVFLIFLIIFFVYPANQRFGLRLVSDLSKHVKSNYDNYLDSCELYRWSDLDTTIHFAKLVLNNGKTDFKINKKQITASYFYLGFCEFNRGNYQSAQNYLDSAKQLFSYLDTLAEPIVAKTYGTLANLYNFMGDYHFAELYFLKALLIFRNLYGEKSLQVAMVYNNLGVVYERVDELEKSLMFHQKALEIREYLNGKNHILSAISNHNIGYIYLLQQKYDQALNLLNQSLKIFELNYDSIHSAEAYNNIGIVWFYLKKYKNAEFNFRKALELRTKFLGKKSNFLAQSYNNLGQVFLLKKDYDLALKMFHNALRANNKNFNSFDLHTSLDTICPYSDLELLESYKSKAECYLKIYDLDNQQIENLKHSVRNFELAIKVLEKMLYGIQTETSQLHLKENKAMVFYKSIISACRLYMVTKDDSYLNKAFLWAEMLKSSILLSNIQQSQSLNYSNIPDSLLELEKHLKREIGFYQSVIQSLNRNDDKFHFEKNEQILAELTIRYDNLKLLLKSRYPEYYKIKYYSSVSLENVQKLMKPEEILLEYIYSENVDSSSNNNLIIFCISKQNISSLLITVDSTFDDNILKLRDFLLKPFSTYTQLERFCEISYHLYQKLIQPFENEIKSKSLIIIPDGILNLIPFEILITKNPAEHKMDFHQLPYIIFNQAISYGFSASVLFYNEKSVDPSKTKDYAVFLPQLPENFTDSTGLSNLLEMNRNKNSLNKIFNADFYYGNKVDNEKFFAYSGNYRIVQISTHALVNDSFPLQSKLIFSGNQLNTVSYLYTYDLYRLRLNAELVVLTACNTGLGKIFKGEGVASLARAFTYSGCLSQLYTLWSVTDQSASELSILFYENLAYGYSKSEALRQAKITYLNSFKPSDRLQPYYWAGFVLNGNTDPIKVQTKQENTIYIVFGVILLVVSFSFVLLLVGKKEIVS